MQRKAFLIVLISGMIQIKKCWDYYRRLIISIWIQIISESMKTLLEMLMTRVLKMFCKKNYFAVFSGTKREEDDAKNEKESLATPRKLSFL